MSNYKWEFMFAARGGHRYWREVYTARGIYRAVYTGRVAIADRSGDGARGQIGRPDETDDGVLFLDATRKPAAHYWKESWGKVRSGYWIIPVVTPDGAQFEAIANDPEYQSISQWLA